MSAKLRGDALAVECYLRQPDWQRDGHLQRNDFAFIETDAILCEERRKWKSQPCHFEHVNGRRRVVSVP